MKRKLFIKIISLMVLTVSFSMVCFGCNSKSNETEKTKIKPTSIELTTEEVEVPIVDGLTDPEFEKVKIVTATIYPAEAVVESISWNLEWLNNEPNYGDVNEYLEVKLDDKDFRIAYLTILKGFEGAEITLNCTIDDVDLTKSTTIQFNGKPQELVVERSDGNVLKNGDIISLAPLGDDFLYEFNIKPTNDIDNCGSKYNQFKYELSIINARCHFSGDCIDLLGYKRTYIYRKTLDLHDLLSYFSLENNVLTIGVLSSEENVQFDKVEINDVMDTLVYDYENIPLVPFYLVNSSFWDHTDDLGYWENESERDVYIKVNIKEEVSGVEMCFYFNIQPDLSLSDNTIIF